MKKKKKSRDPALAALRRASRAAWKLAVETKTGFHVWQDGRVVNLNPQPKKRKGTKKAHGRGARATVKIKSRDPDIRGSWPALLRAARAARKLAFRMNTPFYVVKNGRTINLNPRAKKGKKTRKANRRGDVTGGRANDK